MAAVTPWWVRCMRGGGLALLLRLHQGESELPPLEYAMCTALFPRGCGAFTGTTTADLRAYYTAGMRVCTSLSMCNFMYMVLVPIVPAI